MLTRPSISLYQHLAVAALGTLVFLTGASPASEAKTPGKTYCFLGFCHRVLTLDETRALVGRKTIQTASNYDDSSRDRFNPCGLTSSGAVFRADKADNAASPIYPDGTVILVRHPKTQKSAALRVNSAGPYHHDRLLDVSHAVAQVLDFARQGVAKLEVQILQAPTKAEAGYRKNRVYPPVPGYIGRYASIDLASAAYAAMPDTPTAVAGLYPQMVNGAQIQSGTPVTGNGIERTWLAKAVTFRASKLEAKLARRTAIRLARLDQRHRRPKPHNVA